MNFVKAISSMTLMLAWFSATSQANQILQTNNTTPLQVVESIITKDVEQLWEQDFNHYQKGLLKAVAERISNEVDKGELNNQVLAKLSFYLRIYSSFGPDENWTENTAETLNNALVNLSTMRGFYRINKTTAKLHESYAVALYRLYFLEPLQPLIAQHVKPLSKLIALYATTDLPNDLSIDYAMWEVVRAGAILPYEARRKNKTAFTKAVQGNRELQQALIQLLTAKNSVIKGDNWPKKHALWALAQHFNLYDKQYLNEYYKLSKEKQKQLDDDEISLPIEKFMDKLDDVVWNKLSESNKGDLALNKHEFSIPYVVSTFRGKSECEEGTLKNRCIAPTISQALPIEHHCSDSVYILTQEMTEQQLNDSCQQLIAQEADFHQKLNTNKQPVANDFNDKLRIVIFDNAAEYNKYGQLIFDINTDNGGMYIEGTTQDPENIASFYTYEHFWVRPKFSVWNLNHEFVHYLDGRYIKYDTFNHFPSHLVWWSEGLGEYISQKDTNPRAFKLLHESDQKEWPSLAEVFATEYKDGSDRVYKWGYFAVRFMYEKHQTQYRQLAHFLKTDFFDGYKKLLDQSGEQYADEFVLWLTELNKGYIPEEKDADPYKPRQFYRYTYKDYLQPAYLKETKHHMHWQYWHENALSEMSKSVKNF